MGPGSRFALAFDQDHSEGNAVLIPFSIDPEDILGPLAGFSIIAVIFGLIMYAGMMALMLWLFYLIIRTAVKNGILKADEERAARGMAPHPPQSYPPQSYSTPTDGRTGYGRPVP